MREYSGTGWKIKGRYWLILGLLAVCLGCEKTPQSSTDSSAGPDVSIRQSRPTNTDSAGREKCLNNDPLRIPLFGDLHVHTSYSFDAAANSTGGTPADAYQFAKGEPIPFFPIGQDGRPTGQVRIDRPLDFVAVTDHGEFLGERELCRNPESPRYNSKFCQGTRISERQGMMMFGAVITSEAPVRIPEVCGEDGALCREYARGPWQRMQEAAENAYDRSERCEFTSFVAYEYTGTPGTSNYHRNVIFRNTSVPDLPVSYVEAPTDSQLWAGLDQVCPAESACDYLTIPHNTNLSNGRMGPYFKLQPTLENKLGYAKTRLQREPIIEIFQHKGGSECVNGLSSVLGAPDELCDIEAVRRIGESKSYATRSMKDGELTPGRATEVTRECKPDEIGANGMLGAGCVHVTDFVRSALLVGLREENETGSNPVKLGFIGSTDTHTATPGAVVESDWRGAISGESTPAERLQPGLLTSGIDGNPGGLAGVWATENSRDAIFDAMLRREVFGTSGPRILPRFFAGWQFADNLCQQTDLIETSYALGVPMGADLPPGPEGAKPRFVAYAAKDPEGRNLQALQLVKGWVDTKGDMHNEVKVLSESKAGQSQICVVYEDPDFDPDQSAYYYLRAVETPSPRWHRFDCDRLLEAQRPQVCFDDSYPDTIREMAWSSPIWYSGKH